MRRFCCYHQVATFVDETLNIVAAKLEQPAQHYPELLGADGGGVTSLHVCSLYTCARLNNGALYWWSVRTNGFLCKKSGCRSGISLLFGR